MTDDERARHDLLARLEEVLGPEHAAQLMENLPPRPWSELVTKDDLAPVKADVAGLKTDVAELKTDVAGLKTDMSALRTEMNSGFTHLHEVMDLRFSEQSFRLEALVRERVDAQTKLLVFAIIGALLTTAGITVGSAAL